MRGTFPRHVAILTGISPRKGHPISRFFTANSRIFRGAKPNMCLSPSIVIKILGQRWCTTAFLCLYLQAQRDTIQRIGMTETGTKTNKDTNFKTKQPSQYHVVMHNDDETTMDFVVMVLVTIFHKSENDAESLMMKVHLEGFAIVGTYYKDIAASKAGYAMAMARKNGFPLRLTVEMA